MGALEGPRALGPLLLLFNNKTKKKTRGVHLRETFLLGGKSFLERVSPGRPACRAADSLAVQALLKHEMGAPG